jgi:hypothetical protein
MSKTDDAASRRHAMPRAEVFPVWRGFGVDEKQPPVLPSVPG